jgi:hypothetical protein
MERAMTPRELRAAVIDTLAFLGVIALAIGAPFIFQAFGLHLS